MSRAILARLPETAPASKQKASFKAATGGLRIGEPNDSFEWEADRVADEVMAGSAKHHWSFSKVSIGAPLQRKWSCGGSGGVAGQCAECNEKETLQRKASSPAESGVVPPIVRDVLTSPGLSLDKASRDFFEPRFAHDFSHVRVHTDSRSAESAQAVNALAYTVGSDVVFGTGQYQPGTPQGRRLLAHELTHAVQQRFQTFVPEQLEIGPAADRLELEADAAADRLRSPSHHCELGVADKPRLQRQTQQPVPQTLPPTPGFSVNQGEYLKMVRQALDQMQGRLVASQTLAPTIKPMLDALVARVVWVDGQGKQQGGGGAVHQQFPGTPPVSVNLTLVLDDSTPTSTKAGDFTAHGTQSGTIRIFIKKIQKADDLAEALFHEALHTMVWSANRPAPPDMAQKHNPQTQALTRARHAQEVQLVRNVLDNLTAGINPRRKAKGQAPITSAGLDRVAPFLVEEALVYAETFVFRYLRDLQQTGVSTGPASSAQTGQQMHSFVVNQTVVDNYVFDFSVVFQPGDRALLTPDDQQTIAGLSQILENLYNRQIRQRTAAPLPMTVPSQRANVPLHPLNP